MESTLVDQPVGCQFDGYETICKLCRRASANRPRPFDRQSRIRTQRCSQRTLRSEPSASAPPSDFVRPGAELSSLLYPCPMSTNFASTRIASEMMFIRYARLTMLLSACGCRRRHPVTRDFDARNVGRHASDEVRVRIEVFQSDDGQGSADADMRTAFPIRALGTGCYRLEIPPVLDDVFGSFIRKCADRKGCRDRARRRKERRACDEKV